MKRTIRDDKLRVLRFKLNENKVFFEIFSYVTVGLAMIFLAFQANNIAKQQTEILSYQTELMKMNFAPIFNIALSRVSDDYEGTSIRDYVELFNEGNPINVYDTNLASICYVYVRTDDNRLFDDYIFIVDYMGEVLDYDNMVGKLVYRTAHNNATNLFKIQDETIAIIEEKYPNATISFDMNHIMEIVYVDELGNDIKEYFSFDHNYNYRISNEKGSNIFSEMYNEEEEGRYLSIVSEEWHVLSDIIIEKLSE